MDVVNNDQIVCLRRNIIKTINNNFNPCKMHEFQQNHCMIVNVIATCLELMLAT